MNRLKLELLTPEKFKPFGEVFRVSDTESFTGINQGYTKKYENPFKVDVTDAEGSVGVHIFCGEPRALPYEIKMLERHPWGSQLFIPLRPLPYVVIVADGNANALGNNIKGFMALHGAGVNYRKGIWHYPLFPLDRQNDFIVVDRIGPGNNLEETMLQSPLVIDYSSLVFENDTFGL